MSKSRHDDSDDFFVEDKEDLKAINDSSSCAAWVTKYICGSLIILQLEEGDELLRFNAMHLNGFKTGQKTVHTGISARDSTNSTFLLVPVHSYHYDCFVGKELYYKDCKEEGIYKYYGRINGDFIAPNKIVVLDVVLGVRPCTTISASDLYVNT